MDFQELENIVSAMTVRLKEKSEEVTKERSSKLNLSMTVKLCL